MKELFEEFFDYWGLKRKYNSLMLKYEKLEEIVKCELYKEFIKQFVEVEKVNSLILECKKYREDVKKWKRKYSELEATQKRQKVNIKATK